MIFLWSVLLPPNKKTEDGEEQTALLIERVKNGDDQAFGEIVERYEKLVFHAVCKVLSACGRATDAADGIAEDAFVKAWRNLAVFRGECAFSTWLYRIAVNTARDYLRAEARQQTVPLTAITEDGEDDGREWDIPVTSGDGVPEASVERKETILAVRRAVESLPDDMRRVVVMRDLNEMTYAEIAEVLGIELGTVKSRLNRGRAALKKILEDGNFL